jgi:biotin carboxyl carrier protein
MATFFVTAGKQSNTVQIEDNGTVRLNGQAVDADVRKGGPHRFSVILDGISTAVSLQRNGDSYYVYHQGVQWHVTVETERTRLLKSLDKPSTGRHKKLEIFAPMPALVVRLEVQPGDHVREGQGLVVLEAMKMENEIKAHHSGIVKQIRVQPGKPVEKGELLMLLEEA